MAQIAKAAGTENQVVGKVFILNGTVKAVSPDGTVRVLAPNSPVYANERIITESDGSVSIQFDGPPVTQMDLGRMTEVLVDQDVYAGVTPEVVSEAAAEAEQVQQSLLQGDQPIDLEATAAGGATGAGGGHPVVNFALDGNEGDIKSGAGTTGIDSTTVGTLGSVFAPAADGTPAGGMTVAATMDDEGLHDGIPGGDGDAPGELITTSGTLPHDFGTDGAGSIGFVSMDGTTGELGSEEVSYSWDADTNTLTASSEERGDIFTVVVDPATGAYTLQLLQNVLHAPGDGENDATANLTYTVTDADGDTATGTLTINIDDDTPVLLGSGADSEGSTGGNGFVPTYEGIPGPGEGGNALVTFGDAGFGEQIMPRNDDGSSSFIDVSAIFPGGMKLFGQTYDGFYINNNGNITFGDDMSTFTPFAITGDNQLPMIAPFFADVDTRGAAGNVSDGGTSTGTNLVWYHVDEPNGVITITWDDVGYYSGHTDHVNAFQLRIFNQGDQNFSFEFRYENLDWTTGDASDGSGGLGGVVAHAGWTAGDGVNYYELPQSGDQTGMLGLETTSNPGTTEDGNWVFNVVGGEITIDNSSDTVTVEDEQLNPATDEAAGVAGDPTPDYTDTATGTIVDNVNWGADGFGSATEFKVGDATFETGTTVYWSQDGTFLGTNVGEDSEQPAASLVVNSDGTYTYNLLDNLLLGQDVQGEQIDVLSTVSITGVDGDGDPISVPLTLNVQDDIPVLLTTGGEDDPFSSDTVTVEDEKMQGWLGRLATDEHDGGVDHVTGTIVDNVNWGADGFDSATEFSVDGQTFDVGTIVYWSQDGTFLGTNVGEDSEQPAASLLVNSDGTYTYNLLDNLLLGQDEQGEQIDVLATVSITGQDGDGDTQAVNVNLQVQDDMPLCITLPDIIAVEDEKMPGGNDEHDGGVGIVNGTIVNNAAWGADGFGSATTFSVDGQTFDAGTTVYWSQDGTFLGTNVGEDSEQPAASLLVNSNGTYTYNLLDNVLLGQDTQGEQINLLDTVTITAQDADGDNVDVNVYLKVQDDKPSSATSDTVTVEDEHMPGGINEWFDGGVGHVTGTIVDNVSWGADGFGSATEFKVGDATFETGTTVYWSQDGTFLGTNVGEDSDQPAASLVVNSDGTYTYNLLDNLLLGQDEQGEQIDVLATVSITGQDGDGDTKAVNVNLQVQDDIPLCITLPDIIAVEDEKMDGGNDEHDGGVGIVNGTIVNNALWGADGFGSATEFKVGDATFETGTTVYWSQDGTFLGTNVGEDSDQPAASLLVNSNGTYTYTLLDNVLLGQGTQGEQINLLDTVTITAQDADGDTVAVGVNLLVQDDKPGTMVAEANAIVEDEQLHPATDEPNDATPDHSDQVSGDVSDNGSWGADGFGAVTQIQVGSNTSVLVPSDGSVTVYFAQDGSYQGTTSGDNTAANLVVNSDGTYTFTLTDNLLKSGSGEQIDTLGTVKFTGVDADGDKATVNLTLQVQDDVPTADVNAAVMVDDDDVVGAGGNPGGPGDDAPAMTSGTLAHDFGADGAGSIDFASMNGTTGLVGTETVTYSWDAVSNTLTAEGPRGDLFEVVVNPATGAYTVTQLDNVLHEPPVADHITINTSNYTDMQDMVGITVGITQEGAGMALSTNAHSATLITTGDVFGITSDVDGGDGGRFNEINHIDDSSNHESEVMIFELQGGKTATHATVDLTLFYKGEDMGAEGPHPGHATVVGDEIGSYALYNNGVQVQGATTFTANSTGGTFTLDVTYAAGFDEIRFGAVQGTNDPQGEDSSDYNVQAITFDLMPEAYENNAGPVALTYTVTDGDGDSVNGTLNLTFDDDTPVAYNSANETGYDIDKIEGTTTETTMVGDHAHETSNVLTYDNTQWASNHAAKVTFENGHFHMTDDGSSSASSTEVSTPTFSVAAHSQATISFDVNVNEDVTNSGDTFSWTLYKMDGSDWDAVTSGHTHTEDKTFTHSWTEGDNNGTYRMVFEANDMSNSPASEKYTVKIDDIKVTTTTPDTYDIDGIPVQGNLLTGSNPDGSFGADGGHVQSIAALDGTTIIPGHSDNTSSVAPDGYDLQVTGKYGGTLAVDSNDGDYLYTPPTEIPAGDVTEKFSFTLIDGDGDTTNAQLSMLIDDPDHHGPC